MAKVKGTAVVATLRFLEEQFGRQGVRSVLAALPPTEHAFLDPAPLASIWYPMSLLGRLMREAQAQYGTSRPGLLRDLGRASADYSLTTIYKIFFKVGSPQFIIGRAAKVFGSYYDTGDMRVVESGPGTATVDLVGLQEGSVEFCERIRGWMERTMELCGAKNLRSAHSQCVHRGDPVCRFRGDWD